VGLTTRCPKCGKNNYGDVKKCSFCGSPLVFIPGEDIPQISEDDVQAKLSAMKVDRIRNPLLIGGGGIVSVVGIFLAIILFLIFMVWVFSPSHVDPYIDQGSMHYDIPGGEEYIFGEITKKDRDTSDAEVKSYGYKAGYYAYEIDGDGVDKRERADEDANTALEPDLWIYSEKNLGEDGDMVLVKVSSKTNDFNEVRPVTNGKAVWGGSGWITGGWIFLLPGFLLILAGIAILVIGLIGKADRSMERLMEEDKEFRRQQLMLREAARKQMEASQQQQEWASYSGGEPGQPQPVGAVDQTQPQPVPAAPAEQVQYAPQGAPLQAGYQAPAVTQPQPVQQMNLQPPQQMQQQPAPTPVQQPAQPQVQLPDPPPQ
jgi:hypothetical protein